MTAEKRILKEIKHLQDNPCEKFTFKAGDDKYRWQILVKGPVYKYLMQENSPYEGCILQMQVDFPLAYPFESPKIKFLNKVYHPNVSSKTGEICLSTLSDKWSPAMTIKNVIIDIIDLLHDLPTTTCDFYNQQAYQMLRKDKSRYLQTARQWADKYSCAAPPF